MNTPIADFVRRYADSQTARLHMPGHKGKSRLGCEPWDLTEIAGADSLYEADSIIAQSEQNAAALFGTRRTLFSTEGSSQCIRAMLYLAVACRPAGSAPVILAARNVHKAFVYAAALVGFGVEWLYPDGGTDSLCACPVSAESLEHALAAMAAPPAAVYITSPDYLGGLQDIAALAEVCHAHGAVLAVDNAHGAYLHFLDRPLHPMDLGADICCDSAHKTLPVLTGGAYLHISHRAPAAFSEHAKSALAMFGSTSPSYLTLCSLDLCNAYLADGCRTALEGTLHLLDDFCEALRARGWRFSRSEPMKITLHASACGLSGTELADRLRRGGVECEYADADDTVLMPTPDNSASDLNRALEALGLPPGRACTRAPLPRAQGRAVMTVREALFSPHETIPAGQSMGRICAAPTVACPPAIPIAVSGEVIGREAVDLFVKYGVREVDVVKEI